MKYANSHWFCDRGNVPSSVHISDLHLYWESAGKMKEVCRMPPRLLLTVVLLFILIPFAESSVEEELEEELEEEPMMDWDAESFDKEAMIKYKGIRLICF